MEDHFPVCCRTTRQARSLESDWVTAEQSVRASCDDILTVSLGSTGLHSGREPTSEGAAAKVVNGA